MRLWASGMEVVRRGLPGCDDVAGRLAARPVRQRPAVLAGRAGFRRLRSCRYGAVSHLDWGLFTVACRSLVCRPGAGGRRRDVVGGYQAASAGC
jgi:hypothetical protein